MPLTYCGNIVRQQDSDRFLLSLFASKQHRPALWALFAFNYEIAKTREVVSDTTIGLIRLQWWRDEIGKIYKGNKIQPNEILQALAQAIEEYNLPQKLFDDLIYAREFDLEGIPPANIEGLLKYCEYINAPLMRLALKILGEECNDTQVVDISVHYSLVGMIRSVPYMLKMQFLLLPQDILAQYDLSQQKLFNFKGNDLLPKVIKQVFEAEKQFRNDGIEIKLPKFLKKTQQLADMYQAQIKAVDFDVFDVSLSVPPKFMALRLWAGVCPIPSNSGNK